MNIVISAFYQFAPIANPTEVRDTTAALAEEHGIRGTILIANEGLNGTIAGSRQAIDAMNAHLRSLPGFEQLETKESFHVEQPFKRLKVKVKREIVTINDPKADPLQQVGTYVEPEQWNDLIQDSDVLLIDTRNDYEVALGTFEGAVDPGLENFSEFPSYVRENLDPAKHRKVAMFCTGGIRCEKASALMLAEGFENVYHLKGGILKYLEKVAVDQSAWKGECFVFDERVAVDHELQKGKARLEDLPVSGRGES